MCMVINKTKRISENQKLQHRNVLSPRELNIARKIYFISFECRKMIIGFTLYNSSFI